MSKKIIVKREFRDPVMQGLYKEINKYFEKFQRDTVNDITNALKYPELIKARKGEQVEGHEYIKRTGGPGNYRYWYRDERGRLYSSNEPLKDDKKKKQSSEGKKKLTVRQEHIKKMSAEINPKDAKTAYEQPKLSSGLIGEVKTGLASKEDQKKINNLVRASDRILKEFNIKLKDKPTIFSGKLLSDKESVTAYYLPKTNAIRIRKKDEITKSIIHEVGHAIDFALGEGNKPKSQMKGNDKVSRDIKKMFEIFESTDYYQRNKDAVSSAGDMIFDRASEKFARIFEAVCYGIYSDLVSKGQMKKGLDFFPTALSAHRQQRDLLKQRKTIKKQIKGLDRNSDDYILKLNSLVTQKRLINKQLQNVKLMTSKEKKEIVDKVKPLMYNILKQDNINKSLLLEAISGINTETNTEDQGDYQ